MSLKIIHIVFIILATLMCAFCSLLFFGYYRNSGVAIWMWTGLITLAGTVGLPVYGVLFLKKLKKLNLPL